MMYPYSAYPQPGQIMGQVGNPYQRAYPSAAGVPGAGYEIIRVNGKNGAEAFQMPPNSQILLLDETAPIVWLAQADGAGYKTVTPYKIEPYQPEAPVDTKSLEARVARLEELLYEQSHSAIPKRKGGNAAKPESDQGDA